MLESIGFSRPVGEKDILRCLEQLFPKLKFQRVDLDSVGELESDKVGFFIYHSRSEFPVRIEVLFRNKENTEEREQYIAREMSVMLKLRTIVGWQPTGSSNPYLNLVYDKGETYLADDFETEYAGDGEKEVEIIEKLENGKKTIFDGLGNMK